MKKILLGLGTIATIVAPTLGIISCGSGSEPHYKKSENLYMSNYVLDSIIAKHNFIKLKFDGDVDSYEREFKTDMPSEFSDYSIRDELRKLNFNESEQSAYISDEGLTSQSSKSTLNGWSNDKVQHAPVYMVVDNKTNEINKTSIYNFPNEKLTFKDFDGTLADIPFGEIVNLSFLKFLQQFPTDGYLIGEDGTRTLDSDEEFRVSTEYFCEMLNIDKQHEISDSELNDSSDLTDEAKSKYISLKNSLQSGEFIAKNGTQDFRKLKWSIKEYKFDTSIYEKNSNDFLTVERYNENIRDEFSSKKEFFEKVDKLFYRKNASDEIMGRIISEYHFKKFGTNKDSINEKLKEFEKEELPTLKTTNIVSLEDIDRTKKEIYYSIINYKGVKTLSVLVLDKDGTNNFQIFGDNLINKQEHNKGMQDAFMHGLSHAPLACIKELADLKNNHDDNAMKDILFEILGVEQNVNEDTLTEIEKIKYRNICNETSRTNVVMTNENGENIFTKIEWENTYESDNLKNQPFFDLSFYDELNDVDQIVRVNKWNDILKNIFKSKDNFYKKLESLFL